LRGFNLKYEEFYEKGYQVIPSVLPKDQISLFKNKILEVYQTQEREFGPDNMRIVGEENVTRSPFLYDSGFVKIFYSDFTMRIIKQILGDYAVLSLQNAIFIPGKQKHHQSFFHRDIIHQDFTSSRPLGINLYYCLDDYNEDNGGTVFLPRSHKSENIPPTETAECPIAEAGSVILFDSMVYHRSGFNGTCSTRFGINNMYTLPFVKQQINYPYFLKHKTEDSRLNRLLGFESKEFQSVLDFREYRLSRSKNG
jgi:ectoine hydroxylase-related dioxygenase (phytanoyl-CoA dioxygenase family)